MYLLPLHARVCTYVLYAGFDLFALQFTVTLFLLDLPFQRPRTATKPDSLVEDDDIVNEEDSLGHPVAKNRFRVLYFF